MVASTQIRMSAPARSVNTSMVGGRVSAFRVSSGLPSGSRIARRGMHFGRIRLPRALYNGRASFRTKRGDCFAFRLVGTNSTRHVACVRACATEVRDLGFSRGFLAEYELKDEVLGEGSFGVVRLAVDRETGEEVAVKVQPKFRKGEWEKYAALLKREVEHWGALQRCPQVVGLKGVFEDEDYVYVVEELCRGGDLQKYLAKHERFSEAEAAKAITAILHMLAACHDRKICFGDVKPANFLLKQPYPCKRHIADPSAPRGDLVVKGIDFGCSQKLGENGRLKKRTGTPLYMAPEIFFGWYGVEVDVWAVGMMMYQLLSGKLPFFGDRANQLKKGPSFMIVQAVMDSELEFPVDKWSSISEDAKDLVTKLLDVDYNTRISAKSALQHPWICKHSERRVFSCNTTGKEKEDGVLSAAQGHISIESNIIKFPGSPGTPVAKKGTDDVKGGKGGSA